MGYDGKDLNPPVRVVRVMNLSHNQKIGPTTTFPPYPSRNKLLKTETHITFEMVQDLKIKESTASILYITIYMKWHDP